jgi:hypothetical protein
LIIQIMFGEEYKLWSARIISVNLVLKTIFCLRYHAPSLVPSAL